jgi:formate dehydrogenase major subunit
MDAGTQRGSVFMPFAFVEAAANLLTNPVLDPFGKIPEFKYCAVRVRPGLRLWVRWGTGAQHKRILHHRSDVYFNFAQLRDFNCGV